MKYKTLFRLILKAIGVLLFFTGVAEFIMSSGWVLDFLASHSQGSRGMPIYGTITQEIAGCFKIVVGVYLFFGGKWIVNRAIPGNRPYCPECGYDLTGNKSGQCTECGTPLPPA